MSSTDPSDRTPEDNEAYEARVIEAVWQRAENDLYRPPDEMPFHNTEHFSFVHDRAMQHCEYVEAHGKRPDRFAIRLAAILHDANYHENLAAANTRLLYAAKSITKPFESKEAYSAWIAVNILSEHHVQPQTIRKVQQMILATNVNNMPRTLNDRILVRADLDNISGPNRPFVINTLRLVREDEIMNGPKNPFSHIAFLHGILTTYLQKDLCFGDFDRDVYNRMFHRPALRNLARISAESIQTTIRRLGVTAFSIAPTLRNWFSDSIPSE